MWSFLKKIKAETLVGLLLVSGLGLLVYSSIKVTGLKDFQGEGNVVYAYFEDVSFAVGRVENISCLFFLIKFQDSLAILEVGLLGDQDAYC